MNEIVIVVGLRWFCEKFLRKTTFKEFYEQYGFTRVSDVYLEDGIPHIEMVKED